MFKLTLISGKDQEKNALFQRLESCTMKGFSSYLSEISSVSFNIFKLSENNEESDFWMLKSPDLAFEIEPMVVSWSDLESPDWLRRDFSKELSSTKSELYFFYYLLFMSFYIFLFVGKIIIKFCAKFFDFKAN